MEFDDNDQTELTANLIDESMYAQCDPDGKQYLLLADIVDHMSLPNAIELAHQKVVHADGRTYLRRLTVGWQLCCQWIDGSTCGQNIYGRSQVTAEQSSVVRESGIVIVHDPIIPPKLANLAYVGSIAGHNRLGHFPGCHINTVCCVRAN